MLLVALAAVAIWRVVDYFDARAHDDVFATTDPEVMAALQAEQEHGISTPESLHANSEEAPGVPTRPSAGRTLEAGVDFPEGAFPIVSVRRGAQVKVLDGPEGEVMQTLGDKTPFGSPTVLSVVKVAGPWLGVDIAALPNVRLGWIRHDPERLRVGWTWHSIHVNLTQRRATVRARGRTLRSFTVTIGAPDTRTPTGRFSITDTFRGNLNPVYGCCAIALTAIQPKLPPDWPGGDRVAIHGNGTGAPLGIEASNGCIRAEDTHVDALVSRLSPGTPVFIRA